MKDFAIKNDKMCFNNLENKIFIFWKKIICSAYICSLVLLNTYPERLREWPNEALATLANYSFARRCQFQSRNCV
jgi:hypothetical protein